jgi:2-C-methyl-D-erythritol 4-phosphate cytidylyltransferase
MARSAIIVAGGQGLRMGHELPKQFIEVLGLPILMHTINKFDRVFGNDDQIILVLPESHVAFWESLCAKHTFNVSHQIAFGGKTRFDSVKNGLNLCSNSGIVGIHDGVRPLISESLIASCYDHASKNGSALPVHAISQSLRKVDGDSSQPLDRTGVVEVQTPQCFRVDRIKTAYDTEFQAAFTDDATVFELAGNSVSLMTGEATNLKITTPSDLKIAEAILGMSAGS